MLFLNTGPEEKVQLSEDLVNEMDELFDALEMDAEEISESLVEINESVLFIDDDSTESLTEEDKSFFDELLSEAAPKMSRKIVVKTRKQKLSLMRQQATMKLAKAEGGGLYKRYEKARKMELKLREQIEKKYKSKARQTVQQTISGGGKKKKKAASEKK